MGKCVKNNMPFEYYAKVNKVLDGDTINVDIDLGFDTFLCNQDVRLLGIDAPESRTSSKIEKIFGNLAKEKVKEFISECKNKILIQVTLDKSEEKFGRILAKVINPQDKTILNDWLIQNNYAVPYCGENKNKVQDLHLANRKILIDRKEVDVSYS